MKREVLSTKNKALTLNMNAKIYGTLAEMGGGQVVVRAFFQAGAASGTVAKYISAYDKTFSDTIYNDGKTGRHVSEQRLLENDTLLQQYTLGAIGVNLIYACFYLNPENACIFYD